MTGLPGMTVSLDDGTGTFPFNITQYVRMRSGITWQRGRGDELSDNSPGAMSLTVDNTDGRFTVGSVTYGITLDRQIRLRYTSPSAVTVWTGRLQGLPVAWPTGGDEYCTVTAAAVDPLAAMARTTLRSATQEEPLADGAVGCWPCDDPPLTGSTFLIQVRSLVSTAPKLTVSGNAGSFPIAAQSLGTPDGANGVTITSDTGTGNFHLTTGPGQFNYTTSSLHAEFTFVMPSPVGASGTLFLFQVSQLGTFLLPLVMFFSSSGQLQYTRGGADTTFAVGPANLCDGAPHTIEFETDATTTHVIIDGILVDSRAGFAITYEFAGGTPFAGGFRICQNFSNPTTKTITIGNIAVGPRLTDARAIAHSNAILTDMTGETPAARITRVCGYAGAAVGSLDATGTTLCGPADQATRSVLDILQETAQADLGDAYADGSGTISYVSGRTIASRATPDATVDANFLDKDTPVVVDMSAVVNDATGSRPSGTLTYRTTAPLSSGPPGNHGRYPQAFEWNVSTDPQVQDRTDWSVQNYATPQPRVAELTLDLLSMQPATVIAVLTLDLTRYLRITGLPSQTPGGTTQNLIVQGMSSTLTDSSWTLTLNVVQRALVGAWVLDDTTWSVLDSTTKLYIG